MPVSSKSQRRKGISVAAAVAVVCVVAIAGGVVYVYPLISGGNNTTTVIGGSNPKQANSSTTSFSYTNTSYFTTPFSTSYSTTTYISSSQPGWQEWAVANATLGYFRTQGFIHDAWNYTFRIVETPHPGYETFVANIVSTLRLNINGTWTTGYTLIFFPYELNVTVQYKPSSSYYPVVWFHARNGSAFTQSIRFNATQQRAISIALGDNTVKSNLSKFPYFVDDAFLFPSTNKTYGGDYLVWFFQANGPKILGVFVNLASGTVVSTYTSSRMVRTCYPNGACFSSPWP
jgi:hypothetical protein